MSERSKKRRRRSKSPDREPDKRHRSSKETGKSEQASSAAGPMVKSIAAEELNNTPFPEAIVTEVNGEISCTVEETNRIRALLGMRPLRIDSAEDQLKEKKAEKERLDEEEKQRRIARVERRIAKARKQRELSAVMEGSGLGDSLSSGVGNLSAAEYIKRNRKKTREEEAKLMAEKRARLLAEQELSYTHEDMKGVAIQHKTTDFAFGTTVLTLKDSSVLDYDGDDVLENVNIRDDKRYKELNKRKKKALQKVYTGYDDEEFEGVIGEKSVLSQYDEEKKKGPAIVLDGSEVVEKGDEKDLTVFADGKKPTASLNNMRKTITQEYYTQAEAKVKFKKKKRRKKKRRKKKTPSVLDELAAQSTGSDLGSRKRSIKTARDKQQNLEQKIERQAAYQNALAKANAKNRDAFRATPAAVAPPPPILDDEDDDAFLQQSLARARRVALKGKSGDLSKRSEQDIADEVIASRKANAESDVKPEDDDQKIVFTSTGEFSRRLQARLKEQAHDKREARLKAVAQKKKKEERKMKVEETPVTTAVDYNSDRPSVNIPEEKDLSAVKDHEDLTREKTQTRGLAATLKIVKLKGDIKHAKADTFAGRANDEKPIRLDEFGDRVKLDHRDRFGNLLTPKEAFRQQSYIFHGKKPGRKQQEKRLRKYHQQQKMRRMHLNDTPNRTVQKMKAQQRKTGRAYVTIEH